MFGRRTLKVPVRQVSPRPVANNCCVRTVPGQQVTSRPVQRPVRPYPIVKR